MSRPLRALRELGVSFAGAEVLVLCHHEVRSRSQLDNALPTLDTLRLSATFFPLSAGLDDSQISGRDLAALAARGHTIGCHSHTHPDLTTLSPDELGREIAGSKQILEDAVGRPVTALCYPDGRSNTRVAAAVQRAGFEVAFTVDPRRPQHRR